MSQAAQQQAERLLEILQLQQIEENLYLGRHETQHSEGELPQRLFGGQVLAQAAVAASSTVGALRLHSLHAYFLRAGSSARPVLYEIERIRDGRSFTTRRVVAIQNGQAIFNMDVSFQIEEMGFDHAKSMPNVPPPDELDDDIEVADAIIAEGKASDEKLSRIVKVERPFETRSVFRLGSEAWMADRSWSPIWIRFRQPAAAVSNPFVDKVEEIAAAGTNCRHENFARCLLAYASDMSVVSTASLPHGSHTSRASLQMASLDHALWIHRPVPIGEWLLFHKRTSTAQDARGLVHADFFTEDGGLVASVTQEGLLRHRR